MRSIVFGYVGLFVLSGFCTAQDKEPTIEERPAKAMRQYSVEPATLYYRLELEEDFGADTTHKSSATLIYKLTGLEDGQFAVKCETNWSSYSRNVSEQAFYRLGSTPANSSIPTRLSNTGDLVEVRFPRWLLGLPLDAGHLAFPLLRDENEWKVTEPVTLVKSSRYGGQLQLLAVSPQIKHLSGSTRRSSNSEDDRDIVSIATTVRTVAEQTGEQLQINERYELDGTGFNPNVSVSGTGRIIFSTKRGSVDSIHRSLKVTWKETNREMIVPVTMNLTRLPEADILAYEEKVRSAAERREALRLKTEAMRNSIPDVKDKEAVLAVVSNSSKEQFDALIDRLESEKVIDDPQLARVIYGQMFLRLHTPYRTESVIVRLDPSLEKTVALAEKYAKSYSSFDIALTGDAIDAETRLKKNQLVCFRERSSHFKPAHFYGAVEDVLVLQTRDTTPKLIAVKRNQCRLPLPDFSDPALFVKEESAVAPSKQ